MIDEIYEHPPQDKGAPRWMTTFGDLMSLLLCFFVLLLSFSELDRKKYKQVAGSMEKAFGVQRKKRVYDSSFQGLKVIARNFDQDAVATRLKVFVGRELERNFARLHSRIENDIEVDSDDQQVTIRLMGESTFDSGKADIKTEFKPLLLRIAKIVAAETDGEIIIAGHTDNVPVRGGPYQSNLKLSSARAASVAQFLLEQTTIAPHRIVTMGFGEHRPIAANDTAVGRRKNRRVEITVGTVPRYRVGNG